jgi:hypothetical protein
MGTKFVGAAVAVVELSMVVGGVLAVSADPESV